MLGFRQPLSPLRNTAADGLRPSGEYKHDLTVFLLTTGFYMSFVILYRFIPLVWYLLQSISLTLSKAVTSIIGQKITLSATAMGIPITISLLCYCLSGFLLAQKRNSRRFLLAVAILIFVNVVYLWLQTPLRILVNLVNKRWNPNALDFQILLFFLSMGAIYLMTVTDWLRPMAVQFQKIPLGFSTLRWQYALGAVILLFFACLMLTFPLSGKQMPGTVVFYSGGYLNWNRPVFGKYGQNSIGMFGLLPEYLKLRGYQTKRWDGALTEEALQDAQILVVINLTKFLSIDEKQTIWRFIQKGGSLLVLGEHTNTMGTSDKLNDLMRPFNISLNFDSALPLKTGWDGCLERRAHPITAHLFNDRETAIWVGSSLSISPPAQPVIIGKRGWSDHGDRQNTKRAFLGDYKRSGDEQLGDVVLVASSRYGKGKALVFGDTSTFQNGALFISYQFVYQIFDWLQRTGGSENSQIRALHKPASGGGVLIAILLLIPAGYLLVKTNLLSHPEGRGMSVAFMLSCIIVVSAALWIASISKAPPAEIQNASSDTSNILFKPAYIDASHLERYSQAAASDNSIWGLSMNLARNGYVPMVMEKFCEQALFSSRLFVVIAPTKKFSSHEIDVLTRYMQNGGAVIWTVGWEESEASNNFLKKFGFSIDSMPLGPAEISIQKQNVKFFEAWPVVGGSKDKRVIAKKWDFPIVVYEPIGKGGLLVIGDSGFLLSKNLESYKNYKIGNILFLYYCLTKF